MSELSSPPITLAVLGLSYNNVAPCLSLHFIALFVFLAVSYLAGHKLHVFNRLRA
jgi:hypothetical protein